MMSSRSTPEIWRLQVRLQPRATRSRIVGRHANTIRVQVHAPPVDGAANAELIELLANVLGIPRRAVRIAHGASGRDKVVEIHGPDLSTCRQRLEDALLSRVDKMRARD